MSTIIPSDPELNAFYSALTGDPVANAHNAHTATLLSQLAEKMDDDQQTVLRELFSELHGDLIRDTLSLMMKNHLEYWDRYFSRLRRCQGNIKQSGAHWLGVPYIFWIVSDD